MLDFSLAATDSGPLYTSVFYCGGNIFFYLNLPVVSWRIYIIMVIVAYNSMISIKNGHIATLVTPSLVPRSHLEKYHVNVNCKSDSNNNNSSHYNFCKIFITNTSSHFFFHIQGQLL